MTRSRLLTALAATGLVAAGMTLAAGPAQALNVVTVTSTADGGAGSLRAAMDTANADVDSTEIRLAANTTYDLTICGADEDGNASGDLDHTDGDHLVLVGDDSTINQTCDDQRILHDLSDHDLTISGITFTGGDATGDGGAVYDADDGGPLIVEDSAFVGNHAGGDGGGLAATGDPGAHVMRSVFEENTSGGEGGGLDVQGETTIEDSDFLRNTAGDQGGGSATGGASGESHIIGSTYIGNRATGDQGGGASTSGANATTEVVDTLFSDNHAVANGGGLSSGGASARAQIVGSTFEGNTAGDEGGGANVGGDDAIVTVTNSTFSDNSSVTAGGGLFVTTTPRAVNLEYVTLAGNSAPDGANYGDESDDVETTALDGFATAVSDPQGGGANCAVGGAPSSHGYTWVTDDSCGFPEPSDVASAADPELGPVADNGGPTPTHLPAETSPLIDAIPNADCQAAAVITDDQRDIDRPQGGGCDIGSVETQPSDYPDDPDDPDDPVESGADTTPGVVEPVGLQPIATAPATATAATPRFTG